MESRWGQIYPNPNLSHMRFKTAKDGSLKVLSRYCEALSVWLQSFKKECPKRKMVDVVGGGWPKTVSLTLP